MNENELVDVVDVEPEPFAVPVCGRGKLVCEARPGALGGREGYVTLRLDDSRDDEFWAEVHLGEEVLRRLLAMAVASKQ